MPVPKGPKGVEQEMRRFKAGKLHSGSGKIVTDRKQAIAIALNEAGMSKKKSGGCGMCGKSPCKCGKGYAKGGSVKSSCGMASGGAVKKGGSSCRGMGSAKKGGHFSGTY